jgi:hypothetical protein
VYYAQPVYLQPAYVYTPTITIASSGLVANLFVQPSYHHYVFGDYYDRTFLSVGIFPWFSFTYASGPRPVYYDPLFTFYASINVRQNPGWVAQVREEYIVRRDNVTMRPPRTYIEQTQIVERNVNVTNNVTVINNGRTRDLVLARPIHQLASHPEAAGGVRLERVSAESRRQWQTRSSDLRQFRDQRLRQEQQASNWHPARASAGNALAQTQNRARPMTLPSSPIAAPIHLHAATGESIGPQSHTDHRAVNAGTAQSAAAWHLRQEGESARQAANSASAPVPSIAHRDGADAGRTTNQPLGQEAQARHNLTHTPESRSQLAPGHALTPRSEAPRLHAPSQFTHRQPPPPPRPVPRNEHQAKHRDP